MTDTETESKVKKPRPWYALAVGVIAVLVVAPIALDCAGDVFDAVSDSMTGGLPHD